MIRFTRLLHGKGTVSQAIKHRLSAPVDAPTEVLAFTDTRRPVIFWNITNKCNLTCSHCYINASPDAERPNEQTLEEGKAFIDDVAEVGVPLLLFTGGEPLVSKDFWELAKYAKGKGLRTVISTNGVLITKEVAKRLQDVGIQYVGVSLDGMRQTHDRFRGHDGAFDAALAELVEGMRTTQVLPELSPPNGNGKAYAKFLAIYQELWGLDQPSETPPAESLDTMA